MVASSDPRWLQWEFNALLGLFERVGLRTNVGKTVSMVCRPCPEAGNQSEAVYGRKIMGEGPTYRERQKERVECGGVRERDGGRVTGIPSDEAARKGEGETVDLERLIHGGRRTKNISDRLTH